MEIIRANSGLIWVIYGALLVFGIGYNGLVEYLESKGYDEGFTSLLVAGGTLVTLIAVANLIGSTAALITLGAFVASGLPMIIGSLARYAKLRDGFKKSNKDPRSEK